MTHVLPPTRLYLPFSDGRYTVTARLRPLGTEAHFQLDEHYLAYLAVKATNRRERRDEYYVRAGIKPALERAIVAFVLDNLPAQHPEYFVREGHRLENKLLGLTLDFDLDSLKVTAAEGSPAVYAGVDFVGLDAIEALALQTQEDWAAVARDGDGDTTPLIHASYPSHWRPRDKAGHSFVEVHRPVAGIDPLLKAAPSLIETMITKGPWERFTWTLPRTPDLDEHLDVVAARPYPGVPAVEDVGRSCWVRVERQVVQGFPDADGALFTIRLHILPLERVVQEPGAAAALASAVRSKSEASLAYKSLADWHPVLLAYLDAQAAAASP
jgi:hypothetical protein